jgi:hypothetical protein
MASTGADFGVYLVLWYQCEQFKQPAQSDIDVTWSLSKLRPWETIAVEKFDLAFTAPPSSPDFQYS